MLDDNTLGARILANPSIVQSVFIQEIQNRSNGTIINADPNNTFNIMAEMNASLTSQFIRAEDDKVGGLYKKRAQTAEELANHLSDFDYVKMMAQPASIMWRVFMDRDYLFTNALSVPNTDYKKVTIPATSMITIGSRTYGLYYPVDIRLNTTNGGIIVVYNTDEKNPLFNLSANLIGDAAQYTRDGINYLDIQLPIYQFARASQVSNVVSAQGFNKTFSYSNQFYAVRVFHKMTNDTPFVEIAQTLSETVYDPTVPTAKITILNDVKQVKVQIPQIYFTKNLIGSRIRVDVYTTEGYLDTIITQAEAESVRADFDVANQTDGYTAILENMPTLGSIPMTSTIKGGSNGLTFEELRARAVSGSLYTKVPITPLDLEAAVSDAGFKMTKYLDNIDRRIFYANRQLVGGRNGNVPVTVSNVLCRLSTIDQVSTILPYEDNSLTIMPTTVFQYDNTGNLSTPLTDTQSAEMQAMTKTQLANYLNNTIHTRQPFHIALYTGDKPEAKSFDLSAPDARDIYFIRENSQSPVQMNVTSALLTHEGNGTGGYRLRVGVVKTESLADVDEEDLRILLTFTDKSTGLFHAVTSYVNATETISVYEAPLPTTYHLSVDRYIRLILLDRNGFETPCEIPLSATVDIRCMVRSSLFPTVPNDTTLMAGIPTAYQNDWLVMSQSTIRLVFGTDLSDSVFNAVNAQYGPMVYEKYTEDVFWTYEKTDYTRDEAGNIVYPLVVAHEAGDIVEDEDGEPSIKHREGDNILDAYGQPIPVANRELDYYIQTIQIDARLYASEAVDDIAYTRSIAGEIGGYANTLSTIRDTLIEQTRLYFLPSRTLGSTLYSVGNGVTSVAPLGLGFGVIYYVPLAVYTDTQLQAVINSQTATIISESVSTGIISLTEIADALRRAFGDMVTSINVLGINGQPTVQTLIPKEESATPMMGVKLVYRDDGTLSLENDLQIEYRASV